MKFYLIQLQFVWRISIHANVLQLGLLAIITWCTKWRMILNEQWFMSQNQNNNKFISNTKLSASVHTEVMNMLHHRFSHLNWKKNKKNRWNERRRRTDGRKINSYNIKPSSYSDNVWTSLAVSSDLLLSYLKGNLFQNFLFWHVTISMIHELDKEVIVL